MTEVLEKINLEEIEQKGYRTDYIDGFTSIFLGIILIITAGIINLSLALLGLLAFSFIPCFHISEELRKRYTYPRLSFYPQESARHGSARHPKPLPG